MRRVIWAGVLVLLIIGVLIIACAPSAPETGVQPSVQPLAPPTEQQILDEHPDNLDQALEELEMVE